MTPSGRIVLAVFAAVLLPAAASTLFLSEERANLGLTISPFGQWRLFLAQLALACPLALDLSRRIPAWGQLGHRVGLACLMTFVMLWLAGVLAETLQATEAGLVPAHFFRCFLALGLVGPWCYLVSQPALLRLDWLPTLGAGLMLVLPSYSFVLRLEDAAAQEYEQFVDAGQVQRAAGALERLADYGSDRRFRKKSVAQCRAAIAKDLQRLNRLVSSPLPTNAPLDLRIERIMHLLQLNRIAEAETVLASLPGPSLESRLLRAAVLKQSDRWAELAQLCEALAADPSPTELVYESWGEALTKQSRYREAEAVYQQAIERFPKLAGAFQLKLGLLAADQGQSQRAIQQLQEAVRLDPRLEEEARRPLRNIREEGWGCLSR